MCIRDSYKVVHTDAVPPRQLNPALPAKLENLILKCLAKNPAERYQTGEELARDLGELGKAELGKAELRTDGPAAVEPAATTQHAGRAFALQGKLSLIHI